MPKSVLDPKFKSKRLRSAIIGKRKVMGLSQKDVSGQLLMNQSSYSDREKTGNFTFDQLATIFKLLDFSNEEIAQLFR